MFPISSIDEQQSNSASLLSVEDAESFSMEDCLIKADAQQKCKPFITRSTCHRWSLLSMIVLGGFFVCAYHTTRALDGALSLDEASLPFALPPPSVLMRNTQCHSSAELPIDGSRVLGYFTSTQLGSPVRDPCLSRLGESSVQKDIGAGFWYHITAPLDGTFKVNLTPLKFNADDKVHDAKGNSMLAAFHGGGEYDGSDSCFSSNKCISKRPEKTDEGWKLEFPSYAGQTYKLWVAAAIADTIDHAFKFTLDVKFQSSKKRSDTATRFFASSGTTCQSATVVPLNGGALMGKTQPLADKHKKTPSDKSNNMLLEQCWRDSSKPAMFSMVPAGTWYTVLVPEAGVEVTASLMSPLHRLDLPHGGLSGLTGTSMSVYYHPLHDTDDDYDTEAANGNNDLLCDDRLVCVEDSMRDFADLSSGSRVQTGVTWTTTQPNRHYQIFVPTSAASFFPSLSLTTENALVVGTVSSEGGQGETMMA